MTITLTPHELDDGPGLIEWTDGSLERDVRDAAAVLDEHYPGWHKRIKKPLDMGSPHDCVLAQVYAPRIPFFPRPVASSFGKGLALLAAQGFHPGPGVCSAQEAAKYWYAEIERRKV